MKKRFFLALVAVLIVIVSFAQSGKRHMIVSITDRSATINTYAVPYDFLYIISDSTLYCLKKSFGPSATGTSILASPSNYNIANYAWLGGAVSGTTGAFSSTLSVTGNTTMAGTLRAAGTIGFGTSYNKFTVAAATGNTAIAGTLAVTGAMTAPTWNGHDTAYWVDTLKAQNIRGVKTFYNAPNIRVGSGAANLGIGLNVFNALTSGSNNIGFGNTTLDNVTSGTQNVGVGVGALTAVTTGGNNIGIGASAVSYATSGGSNIGIGTGAVGSTTTASYNIGIGSEALFSNATGASNIAIGYRAGYYETGSNKLIISNKLGGSDTAIVYGVMGATPALSSLQINAPLQIYRGDTTVTAAKGIFVFKTSDSTVYVCRSTTAVKKWYTVW